MSLPLRLPILQNWSCQSCGGCCREHNIYITPEDKARLESQKWPERGLPPGQAIFVEEKSPLRKSWLRLAHQPDGACVFLMENGLCRVHAEFGEAAKPIACRIYPYAFHPAGKQLAVSLRFSCPSVAKNVGRPVAGQADELNRLARKVVPTTYKNVSPPLLKPHVELDWKDTLRIVEALDQTFATDDVPVSVKLLRSLFWMNLIEESRFTKIRGQQLAELLAVIMEASTMEIPTPPDAPLRPSGMARTQFRLLAGQYARKDTHGTVDRSVRGRLRQAATALKLASGRGRLPRFSEELRDLPMSELERSFGPVPDESDEMLTRYFRVKLSGMHFCGKAFYDVPLIEGFHSLALVLPAVLWIARWRAASAARTQLEHEDVVHALTLVDHQHGYSPALGNWSFRRRVKILSVTGEIVKLIVWLTR